jgi:hypothetical protein
MKRTFLVGCVVGTSLALCASALAQEKKPEAKPATPAAPAKPAQPEAKKPELPGGAPSAEMEAWIKAGQPGKEHKALEKFVGTWDAEVTTWMDPSAPPEKSTGTMVITSVLDGRWLREDFTGTFMQQPFTGIGYWGYDNIQKKYVSTWMDSMSTMVMTSTGTFDEKTQAFSHASECIQPDGTKCKGRDVVKMTDNDHFVMEMYSTKPGEKETKCMEIKYTRKSAGKGTAPAAPPGKADPGKK